MMFLHLQDYSARIVVSVEFARRDRGASYLCTSRPDYIKDHLAKVIVHILHNLLAPRVLGVRCGWSDRVIERWRGWLGCCFLANDWQLSRLDR